MDVADDEEGGWAGHHEEIDYTKEVVFEDSSDEEASPKRDKSRRGGRQETEVCVCVRACVRVYCESLL